MIRGMKGTQSDFLISATTLGLILGSVLTSTACLTPRTQLRDESEHRELGRITPAPPVEDVPSGGEYAVEELKLEVTRLQGRLEELEREWNETPDTPTDTVTRDDFKKLEARLSQLEQKQNEVIEALKKSEKPQETVKAPAGKPAASDAQLFSKAEEQFKKEDYEAALVSLNAYLKNPKSKHAEEAVFMRAQSYYRVKNYKKAIVDYSTFPEKYRQSKHMPEALYKIGLSFDAMGMKDDAKGFYEELIEKFPKSSQAKKAKAKLK